MTFSQDPINTLENLIAKNKTKSISIYLVLILAILIFLIALPLIKVDISSQSRGMIRSTTDNVPLSSLVNGKVTFVQLKNNQVVQQGDTLVRLTQENLDTEKATNQDLAIDLQDRIGNLSFLGKNTSNMAILT
jgi:HlyD family secretion protein